MKLFSARFIAGIVIVMVWTITSLFAQASSDSVAAVQKPSTATKLAKKYFHFNGSVGAYGELYNTTQEYKRRPSSTARTNVNATFSFLNFSIPVELVVSTEQVSYRQQFNRGGINPTWRWITFHVWDFNGRLSDFTVSGISIRGGGVEITPDWFRFSFLYGQTQRAVDDPRAQTYFYRRMLMGGKIGFGRKNSTFFNINVIKAVDDENSIDVSSDSIGVSPQENLVLDAEGGLVLFKRKFKISGEGAASIHTLNTLADKIDDVDIPSFVTNIFTPRVSSRIDYAYQGTASVNTRPLNLRLGYKRVGPGFVSLGLPYSMNDKVKYNAFANVNIIPSKLSVKGSYNYSHDNLENQKTKTMKHTAISAGVTLRPVPVIGLNLMYNKNTLKNETNLDSLLYWQENEQKKRQLFNTYNDRYTLSSNYRFNLGKMNNTITVAYSLQKSEKESEEENVPGFDVQTFNINNSLNIMKGLMMGLSFSTSSNEVVDNTVTNQVYGFTLGYAPMRNWRNNFAVSMQKSGEQKAVNYNLGIRVNISRKNTFNLNLTKLDFFDPVNPDREYKEHRAVLTFNRSF